MFQFVMPVTLAGKQVVMLVLSATVICELSSTETSCVSIPTVVSGQQL